MKKYILLGIVSLMFAACNSTPESKADALIKETVQGTLYYPDSYEAIETKIDSSFSIMDIPEFLEKAEEYKSLLNRVSYAEDEVRYKKSIMKSWQGLSDAYYEESQGEYEKAVKEYEKIQKKAKKVEDEIKVLKEKVDQVKGYKVYHRYRAKTNDGSVAIGEAVFIINVDMTEILTGYDPNDYSYIDKKEVAEEIYELLFEEGEWLNEMEDSVLEMEI